MTCDEAFGPSTLIDTLDGVPIYEGQGCVERPAPKSVLAALRDDIALFVRLGRSDVPRYIPPSWAAVYRRERGLA